MVQQFKKQKIRLPYPLKNLDQMGRDTAEVLKGEKSLIITVGYSGEDFSEFYLKSLKKHGVKKFDIAHIYQSDKKLPEHREVDEPEKPINPFGCDKAIIFDNSTRTFRSMAGAFRYVLPRCADWGIHEVYAFIVLDENSGSNSTEIPVYQRYKEPYRGPLLVFREKSPNIFKELDNQEFGRSNKKLTELISTWVSSVHQSGKLKSMIKERNIELKRMLYNIRHRPPKSI